MSDFKPMTGKTYRKKPLEVQAWVFPETMTAQFDLSRELKELGSDLHLYDYAAEKTDTPFQDGVYWRWTQAHVPASSGWGIARIGDIIIYDPVAGWGVMDADLFAQIYEEMEQDND